MKTIFFENTLYRIKKEYPNHLVCQMVNSDGKDIGTNGMLISDIPPMERWKHSGTRIISKSRL